MNNIKVGDIVARKSHGKDVVFKVVRKIRHRNNKEIAILKGITIRSLSSGTWIWNSNC